MTTTEPTFTRLSVNISEDVADIIRTAKTEDAVTATEVVRRMAAVYKLVREVSRGGGRILIQRDKGKDVLQEIVLL